TATDTFDVRIETDPGNEVDVTVTVTSTVNVAAGTPPQFGNVGAGAWIGDTQTAFGTAAIARINGHNVTLAGDNGTTARYLKNGFDIEVDFATRDLTVAGANITSD